MQDKFQRKINYMRMSITDRCNLRCQYCMPNGLENPLPMERLLTYEELLQVAKAAVACGITRFKITGGEPLVRKGAVDFMASLKALPGVEQVTITTNGLLLSDALPRLKEMGLNGINISLDTLIPERFYDITGFDALDILAEEYGIKIDKIKHKALIGEGRIGSEKVVLVKPQTYMNLSGESVQSVFQFYKVDMDHLIVVYDDIDLDVGKLRIRKKGSAGSHNGMKSIIKCLGSQDFPRVRVGVSRPDPNRDLADFVLSRVSKDQAEDMKSGLEKAVKTVEEIIRTDIDMAMNKYNG